MPETALQIDPRDNVLVALVPLAPGSTVRFGPAATPSTCMVAENIPAKQKMALVDLNPGDLVMMYGMVVGEATQLIPRGGLLSTRNIRHRTGEYTAQRHPVTCDLPDASAWAIAYLHGLSPRRWPGGHAQLLDRATPGLLREPQC